MDELTKALAEAIRAGVTIAPTVFVGYYAVRVVEAIAPPLGFIGVAGIVGYVGKVCVFRYAAIEELLVKR